MQSRVIRPSQPGIIIPVDPTIVPSDTTRYSRWKPTPAPQAVSDWGVFLSVYGQPGSGKTTFAGTAAESEYGAPMLMLDIAGGARSIAHQSNLDVIEFTKWHDLDAFTTEIERDPNPPWKTISVDNLSETQKIQLDSITGPAPSHIEIQQWGQNTMELLRFTRRWRDIARFKGINVILLIWDETEKDDEGRIKKRVSFTPKLQQAFPGIVDIIGYMAVENNPPHWTRTLHFEASPKLESKWRRSATDDSQRIPLTVVNPNMVDILAVLRGGKPWNSAAHVMPSRT